jgi:membrane fusion protein, multidrug efflux system
MMVSFRPMVVVALHGGMIYLPLIALSLLLPRLLLAVPVVSGITEPIHQLTLSLPVAGRIERLLVREGDEVAAGAILLHLDNRLEQLEVERRRIIVKDEARLQELRRREAILLTQWREAQQLLTNQSLARKQVEDEEMLYQAAAAERSALEIAKQRERVELQLAEETLQRRTLRAPIAGTIVSLLFRSGESIAAHEAVVQLVDTRRIRFIGHIPAAAAVGVTLGSQAQIRLIGSKESHQATITFVSPVVDPTSGVVEVRAEFDNPDGSLRPGVSGLLTLPSVVDEVAEEGGE